VRDPKDDNLSLVKVFREHPEWGEVSRWFGMRSDLLSDLYVATYEVRSWSALSEDHESIRAIREENPGTVLVY
jgi:hypothetical protein